MRSAVSGQEQEAGVCGQPSGTNSFVWCCNCAVLHLGHSFV